MDDMDGMDEMDEVRRGNAASPTQSAARCQSRCCKLP
jgi:hypothetical protein